MIKDIKRVNVGGIPTVCLGRQGLASLLGDYAVASRKDISKAAEQLRSLLVFSCNGHSISEANTDPKYLDLLKEAEVVHADGQSVVFFSKWLKQGPIPERTATTDLIHDIPLKFEQPLSHYLLGGKQDIVEKASRVLIDKYQNFELAGTQHGYFSEAEETEIIDQINRSGCDILWVGLGKPREQEFCIANRDRINAPVIISCGGCFNFLAGAYVRAPNWMQSVGMEWLHRLMTNPRHLFWRYLTTNPHAVYCVFKHARRQVEG